MTNGEVKLYPSRWVALIAFMLINVMVQILWICYAPVASLAAHAYGVKREDIDLLANLFMIIYLPVAIPAAWAIDHFGFKKAVGFGAALMAVFGLLRAFFPTNYSMALISAIGISIGQPFLLNAFTKMATLWFPQKQRATITGLLFLSLFLGIGLGETLSPTLVQNFKFQGMQMIYGVTTLIMVIIFLFFTKSKPLTAASPPGEEVRALVFDGLKQMLKQKDVYFLCLALFICSGIVNGVFTLIDGIGSEKILTTQQSVTLTAVLLIGGIVGSIVLPAISDAIRRRKPIIVTGVLLSFPATIALVLSKGFYPEIFIFFILGFCVTGLTPVAYQYGAEITHPAPEGTSNGIFALIVQASGFLIVLMDGLKSSFHNSYLPSLFGLAVLAGISGIILLFIRESPEMRRRQAAHKVKVLSPSEK